MQGGVFVRFSELCHVSFGVCIIRTSQSLFGVKCDPSVRWHGELSFQKQVG